MENVGEGVPAVKQHDIPAMRNLYVQFTQRSPPRSLLSPLSPAPRAPALLRPATRQATRAKNRALPRFHRGPHIPDNPDVHEKDLLHVGTVGPDAQLREQVLKLLRIDRAAVIPVHVFEQEGELRPQLVRDAADPRFERGGVVLLLFREGAFRDAVLLV